MSNFFFKEQDAEIQTLPMNTYIIVVHGTLSSSHFEYASEGVAGFWNKKQCNVIMPTCKGEKHARKINSNFRDQK